MLRWGGLLKTPLRLISLRICFGGNSLPFWSNLSSKISSNSFTPALGTTTSIVPYSLIANSCILRRSSHFVTSQWVYVAPLSSNNPCQPNIRAQFLGNGLTIRIVHVPENDFSTLRMEIFHHRLTNPTCSTYLSEHGLLWDAPVMMMTLSLRPSRSGSENSILDMVAITWQDYCGSGPQIKGMKWGNHAWMAEHPARWGTGHADRVDEWEVW